MTDFATEFSNCMNALGLPAPNTVFATAASATAAAETISSAAAQFGSEVTIGELIGAGAVSEQFAFAAAVVASFWAGACIGCAASAAGAVGADS